MLNFSSFLFPAAVRALLALLLLAGGMSAAAQAPAWQSARAVAVATATGGHSQVTATAVDEAGNVYLAGNFMNTVVLGSIILTSAGGNDIFVAKFNPASNQFVWAQRAGGLEYDYATALAVNGTSVYVAGLFQGSTADFGSTTLTNAGIGDVFVAKLNGTGGFVWAQRAGGLENERATALAVSGTSVYVAGWFDSSTVAFGSTTLTNAGKLDVFVAKLTDAGSMGSFVWAQRAGGADIDGARALAVHGTSVYVAGSFKGNTATFGSTTLGMALGDNTFVAKLTDAGSTGSFVWAQWGGGSGYSHANALAVNGTTVYVAGDFTGFQAQFGLATLASINGTDVFVAKLTDTGNTGGFVWAQRAGGSGADQANALAVSDSSVYVAGGFYSPTADFGSTSLLNSDTIASLQTVDTFVAKLVDAGSSGSFAWAKQAGSPDTEAYALAVSGATVFVAGYFDGPSANFNPIILANPNGFATHGFLATITDPTLPILTDPIAPAPNLPDSTSTDTTAVPLPRAALVQLYPNPAHGTFTLRLPAGATPAPLILCDARGRDVRRYPAPAGAEIILDLHGLPTGLYILRGGNFSQRLAIE